MSIEMKLALAAIGVLLLAIVLLIADGGDQ
jgi:hypothetical protein